MWETISSGKPSPRNEVVINIDTTQGAALRVGDMKLLLNVPNVTWFKPPELEDRFTAQTLELQSGVEDLSGELESSVLLVSWLCIILFQILLFFFFLFRLFVVPVRLSPRRSRAIRFGDKRFPAEGHVTRYGWTDTKEREKTRN